MRRGTMAVINQSRNSFIERRKSSVAASGFSSGRGSLAGSYGFERQIFNDYFIIFLGTYLFSGGTRWAHWILAETEGKSEGWLRKKYTFGK